MEVRVNDIANMSRAVALLATLDRNQFTKEQQQLITDAVQSVSNVEEARLRQNTKNRNFIREKRKVIPGYNYPKTQPSGRKAGRPRKDTTESAE